jgi:hypothetical protein
LFRRLAVTVGYALTVFRAVIPVAVANIGAVEIVVAIDVDVHVAAPPITVAPESRTDRHTRAKP